MRSFSIDENVNVTDQCGISLRRGRACTLVFAFLLLGFCAGVGQTRPGTLAPASLPPLMVECESAPNYNACSVWIWHGSSYSAVWSNGAIGQLTVASGDSADLRVERADTSGTLAGLSAAYSGHWTGSAVNDGKWTSSFKGASGAGTWTVTPTVTPVLKNPNLDNNYINWYTAQLTGYAIFNKTGQMYASSIGTMIDDFRLRGESPMNPGDARLLTNRPLIIPPDFAKGASYQHLAPIAAIYSDGTTFGDPHVLKAMINDRRSMIDALTAIGTTVCMMGMNQASINDIGAALDKQHAEEDAQSPAGKGPRAIAYQTISNFMFKGNARRLPPSQALKRAWNHVNQLRSGLAADPVKDSSGQLAIPTVAPLECSLP